MSRTRLPRLAEVRLDEREPEALVTAQFGPQLVSAREIAFADDDGVVFVAAEQAEQVLITAPDPADRVDPARRIRAGQTLRQQTAFDDYLTCRAADRPTPSGGICAAPAEPWKKFRAFQTPICSFGSRHSAVSSPAA